MSFKSCFPVAVLFCLCTIAASAQAGQLFPPSNIGTNPNVVCPNSEVLAWTGEAVACVDPTPGVNVSCPTGTALNAINRALPPTCVPIAGGGGGLAGGCDVVDSINNFSWKTETYAWGQGCQPAGTEITVSSNGYSVGQTASSICAAFEASGYSCGSVTGPGYYWASCECVKN